MIDIKTIGGEQLMSVPILQDAVIHEELMASGYIALAWSSEEGNELPVGTFIEFEGERYSLYEPYTPTMVNEGEYRYNPRFYSREEAWNKQPACVYTYEEDGVTVKSREFDWSFVGSPADAMQIIKQAIKNEIGEDWTIVIADSLPSTIEISSQTSSIASILSDIASQCETEYWVDRENNALHLSKCEHGESVVLEVGSNVGVPAVSTKGNEYYTRYYALGSTRNITQTSGNISGSVNKRLTLDPAVFPMGYKDIKGHFENGVFVSDLKQGEIFSKVILFDDIYPSSDLEITDVRARMKYRLDGGKKVKIGGTDENPVYDQYAIWYFKIKDFAFSEDSLIEGLPLSVHFKSGRLTGQEFELIYHDKAKTENAEGDVIPFEVHAGDYEIKFKKSSGTILPDIGYIIPQDADKVTLFNIEMPSEYTESAQQRLLEALDKVIAKEHEDSNTYEVESNPVSFYESDTFVSLGQRVSFINGGKSLETRVLMVERRLDSPSEQKIRVGNDLIQGLTKELRENVASLNHNVDVLAAFNDLLQSIQDSYGRTQALINESIAYALGIWYDEDGVLTTDKAVRIKNNLVVNGDTASGGEGEDTPALGTVIGVSVDGVKYTDVNAGILDLTAAFKNVSVDLSDYYTKNEVNALIDKITAGEIDLANYYTKEQIDAKGFLTSSALNGYAKESWVSQQIANIDFSDYYTIAEVDKKISDLNIGQYATTEALTSGLSTKQDTISDLATIRSNASNGATAYGWGNHASAGYALAKSVPTLTAFDALRSEFDALESALNDDVSGKINTWNEIVDFLDEYSGSEDLATILAGINADIAKRVLQTDFDALSATVGNIANTVSGHASSIGSNASAISVLQGYFSGGIAKNATADAKGNVIDTYYTPLATYNAFVTATNNTLSGKADKATTLAGYGITNAYTKTEIDGKVTTINTSITAVSNRVTTLESWKTDIAKYITIVDGNVKISTNLIVSGDTASGGDGEDTPAIGTVTGIKVNGTTYNPTAGIVTIPDYPTSLEWNAISGKPSFATVATSGNYNDLSNKPTIPSLAGYATETWVTDKDYATNTALTSGLSGKVDKVSGKGLSTNDFTTALLNKLNGIASGAQVNVQSDWSATSGDAFIKNKPTSLPASDVYAWAKASAKPTYTTKEVTENGNLYFTNARAVAALTDTLASYATQSWVEGKKYITASAIPTLYVLTIKKADGTTLVAFDPEEEDKTITLGKADVGLGNVENTALSTWAGSAKITTLGTITSGTWNGSKIANSYLANSAMTIAGNSISLGGSLSAATLQTSLGLGSLAYKSSLVASDIPSLDWSKITSGKPTTLAGYGITDGVLKHSGMYYYDLNTLLGAASAEVAPYFQRVGVNSNVNDVGSARKGVIRLYGGGSESQLVFDHHAGTIYHRYYGASAFSDWRTIIHSGNYTDYTYSQSTIDTKLANYQPLSTAINTGNIGSYAFIPQTQLTNNANADNLLTNGVYLNATGNGAGNSNFPNTYSILMTFAQSSSYVAQFAIGNNSAYVRRKMDSWSDWKTIAFTDSNVASATKLATARTIWGQSFDGTGNVSGALSGVTNINGALTINSSGNVGIGSTSPAYKLDVVGEIKSTSVICGTTRLRVNASDNAGNFGYMRVETVSSNRGLLHIGANYGGSTTITNAGVDVDAIGIYRGVVGIGRTYTYDELYANQAAGLALRVAGGAKVDGALTVGAGATINGNLVVTGDVASA